MRLTSILLCFVVVDFIGEFPATQVFPTRDIVGSSRLRRYREAREGEVAQLSTGVSVTVLDYSNRTFYILTFFT